MLSSGRIVNAIEQHLIFSNRFRGSFQEPTEQTSSASLQYKKIIAKFRNIVDKMPDFGKNSF